MTSNRPYLLRAVHEWICDNNLTPHIVVDASKPGVRVPPHTIQDGRVVLNIAPRAVRNLDIGNDVISFMARFGGASHMINVPVSAVQAIYARENGQGMLLAEDAPGTTAPPVESGGGAQPGTASVPSLQAVPSPAQEPSSNGDDAEPPQTSDGQSDKPRPKGKPSLHVVK